jgi:hypothetical protein
MGPVGIGEAAPGGNAGTVEVARDATATLPAAGLYVGVAGSVSGAAEEAAGGCCAIPCGTGPHGVDEVPGPEPAAGADGTPGTDDVVAGLPLNGGKDVVVGRAEDGVPDWLKSAALFEFAASEGKIGFPDCMSFGSSTPGGEFHSESSLLTGGLFSTTWTP